MPRKRVHDLRNTRAGADTRLEEGECRSMNGSDTRTPLKGRFRLQGVLCAGTAAFALVLGAACASETGAPPKVEATEASKPWEVVPTDEDLADAFLRGSELVDGASQDSGVIVRKWRTRVEIDGLGSGASNPKSAQFASWSALVDVLPTVRRLTGLQVDFKSKADRSRAIHTMVRAGHAGSGPSRIALLLDDRDSSTGRLNLEAPGATVSELRGIYGGAARVQSMGSNLTRGVCRVNYYYGSQYLHFDLPVDIMRARGMGSAQIAGVFDTANAPSDYASVYWTSASADKVLNEYLAKMRASAGSEFERDCLHQDYRARLRRIYSQCLSETLGLSWGAKLDEGDWRRDAGFDKQIRVLQHDLLVEQTFRSKDYWTFANHWQLLLGVLYDRRMESAKSYDEARAIALKLIRERRTDFDKRYPLPKSSCTTLLPF